MSCQSTFQSDLIFTVLGGSHHGKNLPIRTQKCILAFDDATGVNHQTRCAIFRGGAGVTLRNLDNRVMVNGELKPLHWLQTGDRIEFPGSLVLEVSHLGAVVISDGNSCCPNDTSASQIAEYSNQQNVQDETKSLDFDQPKHFTSIESEKHYPSNAELFSGDNRTDQTISSSIVDMGVTPAVESRFQEIEVRLNQLAEQISSLVTMASCGKFSSTHLPETEWETQISSRSQTNPRRGEWASDFPAMEPSASASPALESPALESPALESPASEPPTSESSFASPNSWGAVSSSKNRFNVSDFAAEPTTAPAPSFAEETIRAVQADTSPAVNWTQELDSGRVQATPEIPTADVIEKLTQKIEAAALDPTPREAEESVSKASAGSFTGIDASLSDLLKSLGQSDNSTRETIDNKTVARTEATFATENLPAESLPPTNNLASKFSTSASMETPVSNASQPPFYSGSPKTAALQSPSTTVEDEINAMLSRLFDKSSQTTQSTTTDAKPSAATFESEPSPGPKVNSYPAFEQPTAESSYANMKFGYDLGSPDTTQNSSAAVHTPPTSQPSVAPLATESNPSSQNLSSTNSHESESSIMDVLARLKQEGCWDDLGDKPLQPATNKDSDGPVESVIENVLTSAPVETAPASVAPDPVVPAIVKPTVCETTDASSDCVEDYMAKLLARMQVSPENAGESKSKTQNQNISASTTSQPESSGSQHKETELMTLEEFVPRQKAAKPQTFDTMREIANTTARTAVAFSDLDRKKARGLMQLVIAVGAFIMSAYYLLFVSETAGDTAFVLGCICLLAAAGAGFLGLRSLKISGALEQPFSKKKKD